MKRKYFIAVVGLVTCLCDTICHGMANLEPIVNVNFKSFIDKQDNERGAAALHLAVENLHPDVVEELINNNAAKDLKLRNFAWLRENMPSNIDMWECGFLAQAQPIHTIFQLRTNSKTLNNVSAISIVDKLKGTINNKQEFGLTPLHFAACAYNVTLCKELIKVGASGAITDNLGHPPLLFSADPETLQFLYDQRPQQIASKIRYTVIHRAVSILSSEENMPLLKKIIQDNKAMIDTQITTLSFDQKQIREGASFVPFDLLALDGQSESTPLHYAVFMDNQKAVAALLEEGAKVDILDGDGNSPLHLAVGTNNSELIDVLVKTGKADVEQKNRDGKTALFLAAEYLNTDAVQKLIDLKADPFVKVKVSGSDEWPLTIAAGKKSTGSGDESKMHAVIPRLVQYLKNKADEKKAKAAHNQIDTAFQRACEVKNLSALKEFVNNEVVKLIDDVYIKGMRLLIVGAPSKTNKITQDQCDCVRLLAQKRPDFLTKREKQSEASLLVKSVFNAPDNEIKIFGLLLDAITDKTNLEQALQEIQERVEKENNPTTKKRLSIAQAKLQEKLKNLPASTS